jgi:carboxyl-terminal processing protease
MKSQPLLILFFLLVLSTSCYAFQTIGENEEKKNLKEFDQFISAIEEDYIYLEDKRDVFDCIKTSYREQAKSISSIGDHIKFYEYLLNEFYDSHVHLNTNTQESYRLSAPIYVKTDKDKTVISNVWNSQLEDTLNVNIIGAEILRFNGEDFKSKIDNFPTQCQNKNNPEIRNWISNKIIAGKRNEPRVLKLLLKTGDTLDFDLDKLKLRTVKFFLTPKILKDNIGYIRINNTLGQDMLVDEIDRVMKDLMDTKAMIIDLRNTVDGGASHIAEPIMGRFITEKRPYQLYKDQNKSYYGYVEPKTPIYTKPLYVLVNRWTGSMGEGMAIGFDGMERATIVGTEMERLAGGMKTIDFKYHDYGFNISFEKTLHIDGSPREEFVPEAYVKPTQVQEDQILNHALQLINQAN